MVVSFLRGINVGGSHKIPMAELKVLYESLGFKKIKTHLNTGNIVFDSNSIENISILIHRAIEEKFGFEIQVVIRTIRELEELVNSYPIPIGKNRYVTLCCDDIEDVSTVLESFKNEDDYIKFLEHDILIYVPGGYGKTKLTNGRIEKLTGVRSTTRNMNTIEKLISIAGVMNE